MYRTCIVVADAARARVFTLDRNEDAEQLIEHRDLSNPLRHRIAEPDDQFARVIIEHLLDVMSMGSVSRVTVCAGPHMLDALREACVASKLCGALFDEVPCALVKLPPAELRARLCSYGLLPLPLPRAVHQRNAPTMRPANTDDASASTPMATASPTPPA